ncbi:MAG: hypothetical protein SOY76_02460 [Veillonella caviae]|nr:hypothetical protein [Veillonella caviae]
MTSNIVLVEMFIGGVSLGALVTIMLIAWKATKVEDEVEVEILAPEYDEIVIKRPRKVYNYKTDMSHGGPKTLEK